MPGASLSVVATAWIGLMPVLFLALAVLGWRHDRVTALVLFAVALGFCAQGLAVRSGWPSAMLSPPVVVGLAVFALGGFILRLWRDRRLGHIRSTAESLAVLATGAVFLVALLSLPGL